MKAAKLLLSILFLAISAGIVLAAITLSISTPDAIEQYGYHIVNGTTTISVDVSGGAVSKINFYIDNRSNKVDEDSTSPYSINWDTKPYVDKDSYVTTSPPCSPFAKYCVINYHTIIVSAVDANGNELANATRLVNVTNSTPMVSVQNAKADLIVSRIDFDTNTFYANAKFQYSVYVKNIGDATIKKYGASNVLYKDGNSYDSSLDIPKDLAPDEEIFVGSNCTSVSAGSHNFTVIADYQKVLDESDENNNVLTKIIDVSNQNGSDTVACGGPAPPPPSSNKTNTTQLMCKADVIISKTTKYEQYQVHLDTVGGNIYAVWGEQRTISGISDRSIFFAVSTDGGKTWMNETRIYGPSPQDVRFPSILAVNTNMLYVFFHDTGLQTLNVSRSNDGGLSWSDPYLVSSKNTNGAYRITYANAKPDAYLQYFGTGKFSNTNDGGASYGKPIDISNSPSTAAWVALTAWKDGTLFAITENANNKSLYLSKSIDAGKNWKVVSGAIPKAPWTNGFPSLGSSGSDALYLVYNKNSNLNNEIIFRKSIDGGLTWYSETSVATTKSFNRDAQIIADPSNSSLYLIWWNGEQGFLSSSSDKGVSWSNLARVGGLDFAYSLSTQSPAQHAVLYKGQLLVGATRSNITEDVPVIVGCFPKTNSISNYTSCIDSDGGKDTSVQGTVIITGIGTIKETDGCWDNGDVAERYCKASQGNRPSDLIGNERITCASGYTCSLGKCVQGFAPPSPAPTKPKITRIFNPIEQIKEERESNPNPIAAIIYSIVDFFRSLFGLM